MNANIRELTASLTPNHAGLFEIRTIVEGVSIVIAEVSPANLYTWVDNHETNIVISSEIAAEIAKRIADNWNEKLPRPENTMTDYRDKEYRLTPAIIKLDGNKQSFGLCLDAGDAQVGAVYRHPDLGNDLVMSLKPGVVICEETLERFAAMFEMMKGEIEG